MVSTIKDNSSDEHIYFIIQSGSFNSKATDGVLLERVVRAQYRAKRKRTIIQLMLKSEFEKSKTKAPAYITGKYLYGVLGDKGSYITIENSNDQKLTYEGGFEVDAGNADKYQNKDVVMYYEEIIESELIDLDVINGEFSTIKGNVSAVNVSDGEGTTLITIENDNEIVKVIFPNDIIDKSIASKPINGKQVKVEYSTEMQKILISYSIESPTMNECKSSNQAITKYQHLEKIFDVGRYVNNKLVKDKVYLEIETAEGSIFEDVLVYPLLGLDDLTKYQDQELTFTYVNDYKNTGLQLTTLGKK